MTPVMNKVSFEEKFALFSEHWSPKIVGEVDDYDIKLVRIQGDFVWHKHDAADEMFLVIDGAFRMDFRDRRETVAAGEMIVVPAGVEHKPYAADECRIMILERKGLLNTGDAAHGPQTNEAVRL